MHDTFTTHARHRRRTPSTHRQSAPILRHPSPTLSRDELRRLVAEMVG